MEKTLIITGSSRGIGAATALLAAKNGYRVCVNYKTQRSAAEEVANEIEKMGGRAIVVQADVSIEEQVLSMFEKVDQHWGAVTALVNNTGILEKQAGILEMTGERLQRIFAANVTGAFICCREAVKRMSTRLGGKGGAIVNVSSIAARTGSPGEYTDYAASKGALDTLTIGLSKEVAGEGIRVNAVRPGFIYTDIHKDGGEPGRVDRLKEGLPMKRGGHPEEVAEAIIWLLSEKASYTTGSFLELGGGR